MTPDTLTIVADRWDPALGGRERYAEDLAAHLVSEGRRVTRAVNAHRRSERGACVLAMTPIPDATHYQLHGGLAASAFAAERASLQSPLRRALFHAALRLNRRRQTLLAHEARLLRGSAALMAFSDAVARDLVERYGVSRERVTVSRPGVDLQRFAPPPPGSRDRLRHQPLRLAFVGHNFTLKGLHNAIAALARAHAAGLDLSLTVAGRGHPRAFERMAARRRVAGRVRFAGPLSQAQVAELYHTSDALLHPTYYDPFPRVAIEALACACPVITTACCGAAEILTPGVDGLVVPHAEDVDGLTRALVALADRATLARMRGAAAEAGRRFDAAAHFRATSRWLFDGGTSHDAS